MVYICKHHSLPLSGYWELTAAIATPIQSTTTGPSDKYFAVPVAMVSTISQTSIDLFLYHSDHRGLILFCGGGDELSPGRIEQLEEQGHHDFYIRIADMERLGSELRPRLEAILSDERTAAHDKLAILQGVVAAEVDYAFGLLNSARFVDTSQRVGAQIAQVISQQPILPNALFGIVKHDASTFAHVTNVAAYAVVLGECLGYTDPDDLERIAIGGMLHDVGKRQIPANILKKNGPLTDQERKIVQLHPHQGYVDVHDCEELNWGQKMMVYQHHERLDGKGYPVGVRDDEIHEWAKLTAVVDVFDAVTGERPYRKSMNLDDALLLLERNAGTQFDEEMVRCWVRVMKQ